MRSPTTIDEFLMVEEEARKAARLRAPAREVRRYHAAVRRFATAWCSRPGRRISATQGKHGVALDLEVEDRYGWVTVFSLKALHPKGEFCLKGPNPDRATGRVSVKVRKVLDKLNKAWRALPGAEPAGETCVTVHLPKLADAGFDRFLQVALEVCDEL